MCKHYKHIKVRISSLYHEFDCCGCTCITTPFKPPLRIGFASELGAYVPLHMSSMVFSIDFSGSVTNSPRKYVKCPKPRSSSLKSQVTPSCLAKYSASHLPLSAAQRVSSLACHTQMFLHPLAGISRGSNPHTKHTSEVVSQPAGNHDISVYMYI